MLQQTRVDTVIPYYCRFLARFPDLQSLADGSEDEVLELWSGLGYYSRARNLKTAADRMVADHAGEFPNETEKLIELPGVGRSTAGAVRSLGLGLRGVILDGNVKRVLSRHFAVEGEPQRAATQKRLWQLAEKLTPQRRFSDYNQAMMDLGATLCSRVRPDCPNCPLESTCSAFQTGAPEAFPWPRKRARLPVREKIMLMVVLEQERVLLERRPPTGVWGGLWALPLMDDEVAAARWFVDRLGVPWEAFTLGLPRRHTRLPSSPG